MQVDYIIIGQGICGTFLSRELQQAGKSFVVIDEARPYTASKAASGIINPVTGRRIVKTWMIDELMPFAWQAYTALGEALGVRCIEEKSILDFFPSPQMRLAFTERFEKDPQYLSLPADENNWRARLQYDFGYGIIHPCYLVRLQTLLPAWRRRLAESGQLLEAHFDLARADIQKDSIRYEDITASRLIFCDGVEALHNPYFRNLPFGLNKGEALLVELPGFPATHIIKKGFTLVPWQEDIFWLGSTYLWEFDDARPSPAFYSAAEKWLQSTVKSPHHIIDHLAAVRPATLERRPFVGLHPVHPHIGIFNGMGTKGCSLAPWFARQLVQHLGHQAPIDPEADIKRFARILSRG